MFPRQKKQKIKQKLIIKKLKYVLKLTVENSVKPCDIYTFYCTVTVTNLQPLNSELLS